jgi:putative tricarboxylic transport membrane protein
MSEGPAGPEAGKPAFRQKSAEIAVAALFFVFGAIVIYDSVRLGFGWQEVHGPRPGYFPFYIGLLICVSAAVNLVRALRIAPSQNKTFVQRGQLKLVLAVLIPTVIYAALVTWIGIYASSVLFIGFFMRWLGKYPWWKVLAVSLATVVVFYLIFEIWFKVPLPKGPVETWLGLN